MNGLILAALLAQAAVPDVPAVVVVKAGQIVPADGLWVSDAKAVEQAKRVVSCETERDELKKSGPSTAVVVLLIVASLVVGGAAGFGVAKLAK